MCMRDQKYVTSSCRLLWGRWNMLHSTIVMFTQEHAHNITVNATTYYIIPQSTLNQSTTNPITITNPMRWGFGTLVLSFCTCSWPDTVVESEQKCMGDVLPSICGGDCLVIGSYFESLYGLSWIVKFYPPIVWCNFVSNESVCCTLGLVRT